MRYAILELTTSNTEQLAIEEVETLTGLGQVDYAPTTTSDGTVAVLVPMPQEAIDALDAAAPAAFSIVWRDGEEMPWPEFPTTYTDEGGEPIDATVPAGMFFGFVPS
ncbi:MAG: hypothetical protein C0621_07285 [Desulfuromonas sp.]|nr:MAG: hypothetical protein C0621_07285 [Desulfuromonas sp.]